MDKERATQKPAPSAVTRGLKNRKNPDFLSYSGTNVRKPILALKLHWIEGTFSNRVNVDLPSILSRKFTETRPFNRYNSASLYDDGRVALVHTSRPEMGTHIIWSGQACDDCAIEPEALIEYLINARFKFSRIDMAIDVINHKLRPQRATKELKLGQCETRAEKSPRSDDPRDKGYTQYIGKKTSEIYLKLYDKAEEMGIVADWTRVELTVRKSRANSAARQIIQGTDYRSMVLAFANFPKWQQWRKAMVTAPVKLPKEQTIGNTEQWLLDSVAPALAKVIFKTREDNGDINLNFYEKFKDEVMYRLEQLSNDRQTVH